MGSVLTRRTGRLLLVAIMAIAILAVGGILIADEAELPTESPPASSPSATFGDTTITAEDVAGFSIDAKEALDPEMTVKGVMGDLPPS